MWIQLSDKQVAQLREFIANPISQGSFAADMLEERLNHYEVIGNDPLHAEYVSACARGPLGDAEIDADTVISQSEDGAYVMTWTWVSKDELE